MELGEKLALAVSPFALDTLRLRLSTMGASGYITPLLASCFGYVIAASSSAGCQSSSAVEAQTTYNVTLADRRYLLWFPENYEPTEPSPLILSYQYVFSLQNHPQVYFWRGEMSPENVPRGLCRLS